MSSPSPNTEPHKEPLWRRLAPTLAAAFLAATNLFVFGAFEIYANNSGEFDVAFASVFGVLWGAALVATVLLSLPAIVLPRNAREFYAAALLGVAMLLWIQGAFLRWDYGELDGRGIDWSLQPWRGWVDVAVWLLVIGTLVVLRQRVRRVAVFIAIALFVLQAGALVVRALSLEADHAADASAGPERVPAEICVLSATQNVFHIIMDSFQTDIFLELVEEEGLESALDGFVVYEDNMSVAWRTALCIPAIFSGRVFDGTTSESEYFRAAMDRSFHGALHEAGYVVNLVPHMVMQATPFTNYYPSPASYGEPVANRRRRSAAFLVDLSAFRQLPHYAKRFIHNADSWRLSAMVGEPPSHQSFHQKAFFADYTASMRVTDGTAPAYHFIHLMPPHPPYVTAADGSYVGEALPLTRENAKHEARYVLRLFVDFLRRLERLGVYDSAVVLLQGDHGSGFAPTVAGGTASERAGRVSALMALKPAGSRGALRLSDAPTTIADVPATMADLLGIDSEFPGESIVRLAAGPRAREFVFVTERSSSSPTLNRWRVDGAVTDMSRWRELGQMAIEREIKDYAWGDGVSFGAAGDGEAYLTSGWSTTSPTVHWNDGERAEMTFAVEPPASDVNLRFVLLANVSPGKVEQQRVRISINGYDFGEAALIKSSGHNMDLRVPAAVLQSDRLVIGFEFPDAVAPAQIGTGKDQRRMAIGLYGFVATLVD